jgi:hypothetical protein
MLLCCLQQQYYHDYDEQCHTSAEYYLVNRRCVSALIEYQQEHGVQSEKDNIWRSYNLPNL